MITKLVYFYPYIYAINKQLISATPTLYLCKNNGGPVTSGQIPQWHRHSKSCMDLVSKNRRNNAVTMQTMQNMHSAHWQFHITLHYAFKIFKKQVRTNNDAAFQCNILFNMFFILLMISFLLNCTIDFQLISLDFAWFCNRFCNFYNVVTDLWMDR